MSSKSEQRRSHTFRTWKDGQVVSARFEGPDGFRAPKVYERLARERVFAVDTESLSLAGKLSTLLIPLRFDDWGQLLETPEGLGMLEAFLHAIADRFGEHYDRESRTTQRKREQRLARTGKRDGRDGRRDSVEPTLAVFFNLPYDFGRLSADRRDILRSVHGSGGDSYRIRVSQRLELEVVRMHFGSGSSFEWYVRRDAESAKERRIVRIIGLDLTGYWKTSLAEAAKAVDLAEADRKLDIDTELFTKPRETFTEEEWSDFKSYALRDPKTTLALYHATVDLLVQIDARVIRRTGVIPPSAPGASARIVFSKAFDCDDQGLDGCHPALKKWQRYTPAADQMGLDAYFGGRSFNVKRGIFSRMAVLDLKSAYPYALALLPDPVTVTARPVVSRSHRLRGVTLGGPKAKPESVTVSALNYFNALEAEEWDEVAPMVIDGAFNIDDWRGRFGVLYLDGESLDDLYPPFRVHSSRKRDSGRLRYVAGRFENRAVTIPEIVVGVASGRLRVDRIRRGVILEGSPETSFLRAGILEFLRIKEDASLPQPLRDLAKLLMNSLYGKLIEIQSTDYGISSIFPMKRFAKSALVRATISRIIVEQGPPTDAIEGGYWGETPEQQESARAYYARSIALLGDGEDRGGLAAVDYVNALSRARVERARKYAEQINFHLTRALRCISLGGYARAVRAFAEAERAVDQAVEKNIQVETMLDGTADESPISIGDYMRKSYKCGFYFLPLYASQVTGLVSAMLGLMARDIGALQGDTDSVHFELPEGVDPKDVVNLPGYERYFATMRAAGYPSPRRVGPRIVDGVPGGGKLGCWEMETPEPSVESVLVRPKVYSHKFSTPDPKTGSMYKAARHGFARFGATEKDLGAAFDYLAQVLRGVTSGNLREARSAHRSFVSFLKAAASDHLVTAKQVTPETPEPRNEALHEAFRSLVEHGKVVYQGRASPRKLPEAVVRGLEIGEFNSRVFEALLGEDPHTFRDEQGRVRWKQAASATPNVPMADSVRPPPAAATPKRKTRRRSA